MYIHWHKKREERKKEKERGNYIRKWRCSNRKAEYENEAQYYILHSPRKVFKKQGTIKLSSLE